MPNHSSPPPKEPPSAKDVLAMLREPRTVLNLAIIAAILLCIVGSFAYVGGWFSPSLLTPDRFVDGFEAVNGRHPRFRRNHAKGLCVGGYFESNGNGTRLSKASVFEPGRVTVIGRFSLAAGNHLPPMGQRRCVDLGYASSLATARNGAQQ